MHTHMRSITYIIMIFQHVNMSGSYYIAIEKNRDALEAIWMRTSFSSRFDPQTPLGGPMSFLIIPNGHECMCEHGKGILEH